MRPEPGLMQVFTWSEWLSVVGVIILLIVAGWLLVKVVRIFLAREK